MLDGSGRVVGQCDRPGVWPGFVGFVRALLLLLGREYAILESLGFCVLRVFTSCCLLAQILVICHFLVVYHHHHHHHHLFVHKNAVYIKWQCTIGERDIQGSVRALKAAPKLHNYMVYSTRNKNSDTQKYTHIKKTYTHLKLTEKDNDFKIFVKRLTWKRKRSKSYKKNKIKKK